MVKVGDRVTLTSGKYSGSKAVVTQVTGDTVWVNVDTPQGKIENLKTYTTWVVKDK